MPYYIDSSENPSSNPNDALDGPFNVLENAQETARGYATRNPGTIYYVNETKTVVTQVYRVEATIALDTEVTDGPTIQV